MNVGQNELWRGSDLLLYAKTQGSTAQAHRCRVRSSTLISHTTEVSINRTTRWVLAERPLQPMARPIRTPFQGPQIKGLLPDSSAGQTARGETLRHFPIYYRENIRVCELEAVQARTFSQDIHFNLPGDNPKFGSLRRDLRDLSN